jgi:hypothetical protein
MRAKLALAIAVLVVGFVPAGAAIAHGSWAEPEIRLVTDHGMLGGDAAAFRADDPVTASELADLLSSLTGLPQPAPAKPVRAVTIAQLDARFVRSLGLGSIARRFAQVAEDAGLAPPARFGTETVARLLGFRRDHPGALDLSEPAPRAPATRAEAAWSAAKVLRWKGWELQYAKDLAAGFALPRFSDQQRTLLHEAVSLIGYPYVLGGVSERPQSPLGSPLAGGFDCSGFIWRVFRLSPFAAGTPLAQTLQGRTTFELAGEVSRVERIPFAAIEPADVLFFGAHGTRSKPAEVDHMGIYLGGGWMISAASTGVSLAPVAIGEYRQRFAWARRLLAEAAQL